MSQRRSERGDALAETLPGPSEAPSGPTSEDFRGQTLPLQGTGDAGAPIELMQVEPEHYQPIGELARGGMGVIRRALDRRAGREVAIKELLSDSPEIRRRFEREARVTARLQHPSIVPVYEVGRWPDGMPFYAMKLVEGRPLDEVVEEALDGEARLALIPQILPAVEAIAYAHERGVIHRDLKPSNVLLGAFGETIVIDWGLAGRIDGVDGGVDGAGMPASGLASEADEETSGEILAISSGGALTIDGAVMGTPAYMSPEQARGDSLDARADVYALGALLYHTLSGRAPFIGDSIPAIISGVLTRPPPPLALLAPSAPADLIGIIAKAMARRLDDRYADAGALARDLKAFSTGRLVTTYRYTSWQLLARFIRRNRALSLAIAVLVVVIVAGSISVLRAYQISERERERAITAETQALQGERTAHQRLAQAHGLAALRSLKRDEHLEAAVLAAAALRENPANPASPHHKLGGGDGLAPALRAERLAGPGATWAAAKALRFATLSRELPAHDDWVYDVLASPDGRWVVTSGADRKSHIFDTRAGKLHRTLEGHTGTVFQAVLRRDGKQLATTSYDGTVRLWSFPDGALQRTLNHPSDRVYGACYASHGQLLALGLGGILAVFAPDAGQLTAQFEITSSLPWRIQCAEERPLALVSTKGPEVVTVELGTLRVVRRLPHTGASVVGALFSPDGQSIITADRQGIVRRFDRVSGELLAEERLGDRIETIVPSADGRWLALADKAITIVDSMTLRPLARLHGHDGSVYTVAFGPKGERLYSGSFDRRVIEWQIEHSDKRHLLITPSHSEIDSVVVSPDGRWLVSGGEDTEVRFWDLRTGRFQHAFSGHTAPLRGLQFLDDTRVVSTGMDQSLSVHDLQERRSEQVAALPHYGDELSLSPSGQLLAVGGGDGDVLLFNTADWERRVVAGVHRSRAKWVGFAPSGALLASAGYDGEVTLIDPAAGHVLRRWKAHETRINDADWHPDGERLTTSDLNGWVRSWDATTAAKLDEWQVLGGERIQSFAWSPDGARLLFATIAGLRSFRPDGALEARLDLAGRTTSAGWTKDGRVIFAANGKVFVLPLDPASWREQPELLLKEAEQAAGVKLGELLDAGH